MTGGEIMNFGQVLKYYRDIHKMTQCDVANLSGINEKYLGRIERGESVPTIEKVEQICMAFDVRLSDMFITELDMHIVDENFDGVSNKLKAKYYCNCCGYLFEDESEEVVCPNCLCRADSGDGYIDKYLVVE